MERASEEVFQRFDLTSFTGHSLRASPTASSDCASRLTNVLNKKPVIIDVDFSSSMVAASVADMRSHIEHRH